MNKSIRYSIAILWLCIMAPVLEGFAQASPEKTATGVSIINRSINYERLKKIDSMVNHHIKEGWANGVVTMIMKDGQVVQHKAYGYADLENKKPMAYNSLFRLMSQTKAITSIGMMMLYEEGKFQLEQPISDFIPEFKKPVILDQYNPKDSSYTTKPAKREINFVDLFTHTSGLSYPDIGENKMKAIYAKAGIPSGLGSIHASLEDKMKALGKLPLLHNPGEQHTYGINTDLLGYLIEKISGSTLEAFLTSRLFKPLGMNDTYFNVPQSKADRLTAVYTEDASKKVVRWGSAFRNIDPNYPIIPTTYFSGGAGLTSTAKDYGLFLQMILNKGTYNGHQFLSPRTVEMILTNQTDPPVTFSHGIAFEITSKEKARRQPLSEGSFSWGGYLGTNYWADPKYNLVCLFMIQQTPNSHPMPKKFQQLVYQSLK